MERSEGAESAPENDNRKATRVHRYRAALALLLLLCALFYLPEVSRPAGAYHDDAIYLLTGRALAHGHGYRIESLPGSPPQTKYPPLYPALIALIWELFPSFSACALVCKLVNLLFWVTALAVTYDLLVRYRYATPPWALALIALRGLSIDASRAAGMVLTEALVSLLVVGAIWWGEYALQEGRTPAETRRGALLAGLLLSLTLLAHTSSVLLWAALAMALGRKRPANLIPLSLCVVPCYLGWSLWTRQAPHLPGWDPRGYYLDYVGWALHQFQEIPLATIVRANLEHLVLTGVPGHVLPFATDARITPLLPHGAATAMALTGLAVSCLAVLGGGQLIRQGRPLLPFAALLLCLPAGFWPADGGRYTFPAGGICLALALTGWLMVRRRAGRLARPLVALTFGLCAISAALTAIAFADRLSEPAAPQPSALENWVLRNVGRNEKVYLRDDARLFLTTGRQGLSDRCWMGLTWNGLSVDWHDRPNYSPEAERLRALLQQLGIRWVIDAGRPGGGHGWGTPTLLKTHPDWFTEIPSGSSEFRVYRWR